MLLLTAILAAKAGAKIIIVETEDSEKKEQKSKMDYMDYNSTQPGKGYIKVQQDHQRVMVDPMLLII